MKKLKIKAFLLAAGLGTRLRPLTDEIPKCLLNIGDKSLLQIWLENLTQHEIDEVLINTHWHHEKVEAFLENWRSNRLRVKSFYEQSLLGSAGTLLANKDWVADRQPYFILYGDNLTNVDLTKIYAFHCQHGLPFTLGVFKAEEPSRCGIAEVNQEDVVIDFVEKPENPKSDLAAAGIYVADSRIFDFFPPNPESIRPLDLGFHVIPRLVGKMKVYYIEEFLMDIGTPESYERAQKIYPQMIQS